MKRLLITGANGLLGSNLVRFFRGKEAYEVFATSRHPSYIPELKNFALGDLLDVDFINSLLSSVKPDTIINTVGPVDLDKCESDPDFARSITIQTSENLAKSAANHNARLIHISTDHLFDGKKSLYTEDDTPSPVNMYGRLKLEAENRIKAIYPDSVVVRTNFYGWSPPHHPPTFAEWAYNNLKEGKPITLFTDYFFTPLEVTHLAEALETVADSDFIGVLNVAGSQRCSKYEFGMALADIFDLRASLIRSGSIKDFPFKARRQTDLSLSTEKFRRLFKQTSPDLCQGIKRFHQNQGFKTLPSIL